MSYQNVLVKNYITTLEEEKPVVEISRIFSETDLQYEKRNFHRQIINKLVKQIHTNTCEELQMQYINYLREAADIEIFKCSTCEYQTIHKDNMKIHLLLIHRMEMEVEMFECRYETCTYKTNTLSDLRNHQLMHSQYNDSDEDSQTEVEPLSTLQVTLGDEKDEPHRNLTGAKLQSRKNTKKRRFGEKARISCDVCACELIGREAFIKHNNIHKDPSNPKKYLCHLCHNKTSNKYYLKKHLLKVHRIGTEGALNMYKLQCSLCEYRTHSNCFLKSHMLVHKKPEEVEWFKCKICKFTTKHKASLNRHLLDHEPNQEKRKKYMCHICSKSFIKKGNLESHMLIHKSIDEVSKIYTCTECSYQTKFKCHLITHKISHQEAKYICDVCGLRTKRKSNYKLHLLRHKDKSEVPLFKCSLCPYETKFKHGLKKHLATNIHSILAKRANTERGRKKNRKKSGAKLEESVEGSGRK